MTVAEILANQSWSMGREVFHEGSSVVDSEDGHRITLVVFRMAPLSAGLKMDGRAMIERRFCICIDDQIGVSGIVSTEWTASATDGSAVLQEEPPSPSVEAHPEPRGRT